MEDLYKYENELYAKGINVIAGVDEVGRGPLAGPVVAAAVILPKDASTFEEAYKAADKALYEAKRRGKNQLVYYSSELSNVESVRVTGDIESDNI